MSKDMDPYANKATLGAMVRDAAKAAIHNTNGPNGPDLQRMNNILVCEKFVSALADKGCMIIRIPTAARTYECDNDNHDIGCQCAGVTARETTSMHNYTDDAMRDIETHPKDWDTSRINRVFNELVSRDVQTDTLTVQPVNDALKDVVRSCAEAHRQLDIFVTRQQIDSTTNELKAQQELLASLVHGEGIKADGGPA